MTFELHHFPFRAMASPCAVQLYAESPGQAEDAAGAAIAEVERIESKYTRYRDDSVTSAINASAGSPRGIELDEETTTLLDYAQTAYGQSGGSFDITSGVLREVWDFASGKLPKKEDVRNVLERVGWKKLDWSRPCLRMPAGMQLDFGGYGKEYAADRAATICRQREVAGGLVDLGGDVAVVGPHPDGAAWQVGVRNPHTPDGALAAIPLAQGAIATSGDYQRCMWIEGRRYSHLLDPRTGWPVEGGLTSVSVVADHCLVAGTASTIAMLKGRQGLPWLDALGLPNLRVDRNGHVSGTLSANG